MADIESLTSWSDSTTEAAILDDISIDEPWALIEGFARTVRTSGSAEERQAVDLLIAKLADWGVTHTLHEPECFISWPLAATVRIDELNGKHFRAKTAAMSISTGGAEWTGEVVYVPGTTPAPGSGSVFAIGVDVGEVDIRGKVVLTEGFASPGKVNDVMRGGALAGIFINPGENIHEGICTTIWGAPDLDNQGDQPTIPVIAVNNASGQELIAHAQNGGRVAFSTTLDTRWRTIPVLVAEIPGTIEPEKYVLLHGHLDSWHIGIGDNATGNATMAEIARVLSKHRDLLKRSIRIAWWSGHSHGRYAGSTWFADEFAIDLFRNCLAQVDCDSPGCRWADTYNNLSALSESHDFVTSVIRDVTGIVPKPARPPRAGDYSFNGIGLTGFYMLSSTMSDERREENGYYAVGGCGGNIAWHTEDDTLEIADKKMLLRDMRMYAASVLRVMNAPILPFNFLATVAELRHALSKYQAAAGDTFSLAPASTELDKLESALERFYSQLPGGTSSFADTSRYNDVLMRLGRILTPINYSRAEPFKHDPALAVSPIPDLAPALGTAAAGDDRAKLGVLRSSLTRGQNRVVWALRMAAETVDAVLN